MKKLSLAKLDDLFAAVAATQSLYLPVDDGKKGATYKKWETGTQYSRATNTVRSAKDFFFPQVEQMAAFKMEGKKIEVEDIRSEKEDFVIFGVRACDAASFPILDSVYLADPIDTFYAERRKHGLIMTMACNRPTETCFCSAFGIDASAPAGGDVTCWMTDSDLLLQANTEKGTAFLNALDLLEDAADDAAEETKKTIQGILEKLPLAGLSTDAFGGDML